jgi:hypothetical protein
MYLDYMNGHTKYLKKYIWKMKVPLKIKIFMWFFHRKVILTKDNLLKRNWNGNTSCCFCDKEETIQHLFFWVPLSENYLAYCSHDVWIITPQKCQESLW